MKKEMSSFIVLLMAGLLLTGCGMSTGSLNPFGDEQPEDDQGDNQSRPLVKSEETEGADEESKEGEPILLPGGQDPGERTNEQEQADTSQISSERTESESTDETNEDEGSDKGEGILLPEGDKTEQARTLAERGHKLYRQGETDRAIQSYRKAHELDPEKAEYLINLGSLYYNQDQFNEARNHYEKALSRNSESEKGHLFLGATYNQLGELEQAREQVRTVLELNPNNKQAQKLLTSIQETSAGEERSKK
jgi:tetratricopeptide (TPR) repeat protein